MNKLPEEIFNQVKDFVIFKPKTKNELQEMVSFYCENKEECIKQCGVINNWDVSNITDMSYLFSDSYTRNFNDPLNNWNVSNVTNMRFMFRGALFFDQPLNNWDTSKVTDMSFMFDCAMRFNQPLNNWDTSKVTDMKFMFH